MSVAVRISPYWHQEIRGPRELGAAAAIEQQKTDEALERLYQERVRGNPKERRRLQRETGAGWMPRVFRRQAL